MLLGYPDIQIVGLSMPPRDVAAQATEQAWAARFFFKGIDTHWLIEHLLPSRSLQVGEKINRPTATSFFGQDGRKSRMNVACCNRADHTRYANHAKLFINLDLHKNGGMRIPRITPLPEHFHKIPTLLFNRFRFALLQDLQD